ncbi:MAG TPA: hypothetical protein VL137_09140 [Polyangiaceae bacterium]|nr:hypothetical protein [Polyangiaceae bacterium]
MTFPLHDDAIPVPRAPMPHALEEFLSTMPPAYHNRFGETEARAHAGIVLRRNGAPVHLEICEDDQIHPGQLCVVTDFLPGLMRTVSEVLMAHSLNILDKSGYCRVPARGWNEAVFFFRVLPQPDGPELNDAFLATLRSTIVDVLKGKVSVSSLSRRSTPTARPPACASDAPEPEPSSSSADRLSQFQMSEPPRARPIPRFSKLPHAM